MIVRMRHGYKVYQTYNLIFIYKDNNLVLRCDVKTPYTSRWRLKRFARKLIRIQFPK